MNLERTGFSSVNSVCLLLATVACSSLWAGNLVLNGDFSASSYTVNTEFSNGESCAAIQTGCPTYTHGGGVTNWTGTGYSIYFIANKQSTQNAVSIWTTAPNNSTKEMLDTATNTLSANGGNFVGLDADPKIASAIAQTIAGLTIGAQYQLKYSWAASQLQSATGITLNDYVHVTFGSAAADSVNKVASNPSAGFSGWFNETVTFTATTTSQTLTFLSKSDSTSLPPFILLDGITLNHVVPEPGTIGLVGAGLGLVALAGARRRKSQG